MMTNYEKLASTSEKLAKLLANNYMSKYKRWYKKSKSKHSLCSEESYLEWLQEEYYE